MSWISVVKAALPLVPDIINVAKPYFTKKPSAAAPTLEILEQQVIELQQAVTTNAESVQELSEDLRETIKGLRDGADAMQATLSRIYLTALTAVGISIVATVIAVSGFLQKAG